MMDPSQYGWRNEYRIFEMRKVVLLLALLTVILGCRFLNPSNNNDPVVEVSDDDVTMNAAIQEAQQTLYFFIDNFQSPKLGQTYFGIKARFPYSANSAEHMWISDLEYLGQEFDGILGSEPVYVMNLKLGDHVTVSIDNVSDWMIIENNKLIGGYTLRVLRDKMTPDEQKKFDEELGLIIDYPSTPIPTYVP